MYSFHEIIAYELETGADKKRGSNEKVKRKGKDFNRIKGEAWNVLEIFIKYILFRRGLIKELSQGIY